MGELRAEPPPLDAAVDVGREVGAGGGATASHSSLPPLLLPSDMAGSYVKGGCRRAARLPALDKGFRQLGGLHGGWGDGNRVCGLQRATGLARKRAQAAGWAASNSSK